MKINFLIISPEPNIGRLKGTVRSIRNNYGQSSEMVCCVEKGISKESLKEMKEVCETHRGGLTVTSLINKGMEKASDGWNMIVTEGSCIPRGLKRVYGLWARSNRDVLYGVGMTHGRDGSPAELATSFLDCSLNGIMMRKEFFLEVGKLSDNPMEVSRCFWILDALEKGAVFKGVLGARIC